MELFIKCGFEFLNPLLHLEKIRQNINALNSDKTEPLLPISKYLPIYEVSK